MNAVIYARYSSDNQREESIEGQLRECLAYAQKNNLTIVNQYVDRAFSARTDDRPAFRQMIRESEKKAFSVVLVWKLDRFSRDRYDSAYYKHQLKKNGVRVISATENISDGPEGIILESMLEGMAEYYSAELAVKVRRGQQENALKCRSNGGTLALGYRVGKDRTYEIDPDKAPIVQEIFSRYDSGESMQVIADSLNERGLRNQLNRPFRIAALGKTLRNRKYIGEYHYDDTVIPGGIPQIIDPVLFDRVQKRMDLNKKASARGKAAEEYLLTTKLFCGHCGALMAGESGTSKTGAIHCYYKCGSSKRHKGCSSKAVRKHWIESVVVETTVARVFREEEISRIADAILVLQQQDDPTLPALEAELKDCEKKLQNLMDAILAGIHTSSTKSMLEELESQREQLQLSILQAKLRRPVYTREMIIRWINQFKNGNMEDMTYRKRIIDIFVNAVYVYEDKLVFTYNFRDGNETVSLADIELALGSHSSDISDSTSPTARAPGPISVPAFFCVFSKDPPVLRQSDAGAGCFCAKCPFSGVKCGFPPLKSLCTCAIMSPVAKVHHPSGQTCRKAGTQSHLGLPRHRAARQPAAFFREGLNSVPHLYFQGRLRAVGPSFIRGEDKRIHL